MRLCYTLNRPMQRKRYVHDTNVNVDKATTATAMTTQNVNGIHAINSGNGFEVGAQ